MKDDTPRREAMKKVMFLEGRWEGEGWAVMGKDAPKHHFKQTEDVRSEVSGRVLAIRGRGMSEVEGGPPLLTHDAYAVVFYDMDAEKYRIHTYKDGEFLASDAHVADDGSFVWGFDLPKSGKIRFTIRLNDKGQWHEIGEYSPDGQRWFKNFEMTLDKK